jgi:3-phenylpropionate/trans-cinnamate dioxygenase ferredoxin component
VAKRLGTGIEQETNALFRRGIREMPPVLKSSDIAPGHMTAIELYGVPVAIANVGGVFYAISDACPHAACSLSLGLLNGKVVTCRNDGSQFDLVSGHVLTGPAKVRVRTYRIQIHGDELSI